MAFSGLNALSLAFTAGAILVLLLALGAIVVLPAVLKYIGLESIGGTIIMLARWPALYILVVVALGFIYRLVRSGPRIRPVALDHLG